MDHIFEQTLRQIESLPDTDGGGISRSKEERDNRLEFCYKRRDLLSEMLVKVELSHHDTLAEIDRLTEEERKECTEGPKPSFRRRATDVITGGKR